MVVLLAILVAGTVFLLLRNNGSPAGSAAPPTKRRVTPAIAGRHKIFTAPTVQEATADSTSISDDEPSSVDAADDAVGEPIPAELPGMSGRPTSDLCQLLRNKIGFGESQETIAISEELMRRGDAAVDELANLLNSGNIAAETAAMRILVRMGTEKAVARAIVKIYTEPSGDSRSQLLKVFGNVKNAVVARALVDMLARDRRQEGEDALKVIISSMEGSEIVEQLARRAGEEQDDAASAACLDALSKLSKPSNVPALAGLIPGTGEDEVQAAAATALSRIGDGASCRILAVHGVTNAFCRQALENVRSPYAQTALMEIAAGPADGPVRVAAIKSLGLSPSAAVTAFLHQLVEKERDTNVTAAILASLPAAE